MHLVLGARTALLEQGIQRIRVVSMPSWALFNEQPRAYRQKILPPHVKARLAVEAGSSMGWHRWVGDHGAILALDHFGASAPGNRVLKEYGFYVENVVEMATALLPK